MKVYIVLCQAFILGLIICCRVRRRRQTRRALDEVDMKRPSWLEPQGQGKGETKDDANGSKGRELCGQFQTTPSSSTSDPFSADSSRPFPTAQPPFLSWLNSFSLYVAILSFFDKRRLARRRRALLTQIGKPNLVSSTNAELGVIVMGGSTLGISSRLSSTQLVVKYADVGDGTANDDGGGDPISKPWYIVPRHVFGKQLSTVIEDSTEDVQTVAVSRFSRAVSHVSSTSSSLNAEM
jgi:hypothetical protein